MTNVNLPLVIIAATAWGSKSGGINSFNMDFSIALSSFLKDKYQIVCLVLSATADQQNEVEISHGIKLISLNVDDSDKFRPESADTAWRLIEDICDVSKIEWWIGHDVISGGVVNDLKKISNRGKSAVIMHMSYIDYSGYKHGAREAQKNLIYKIRFFVMRINISQ